MKSTLFCCCLAILIVCLSNSKVQSHRINSSSARYTGQNEQNKITNSSSSSKISSTNVRPSDPRLSSRQEFETEEKRDTKRGGIESSTTRYQNSQRSDVSATTEKVLTRELDTSAQFGKRQTSSNQNRKPSTPDYTSDITTTARTSRASTRSRPETDYWTSPETERTDNRVTSSLPNRFRTESTTIVTAEKWTPTPSWTTTKFGSQYLTKATTTGRQVTSSTGRSSSTTGGFVTSSTTGRSSSTTGRYVTSSDDRSSSTTSRFVTRSTGRSSSTTLDLEYGPTTEGSATRAAKTKNGDGIVFPASTSARTTSKTTGSGSGNAIPSGFSSTASPSINGTANNGTTTETIDTKFIIDAPAPTCMPGEKKDLDNECRKVL